MFWVIGGAVLLLLLIPGGLMAATPLNSAADFIISFEGFSPTPYWDVSRYSWGYGTLAPGASGTITESDARAALAQHVQADYDYLLPLVARNLNSNQWAALLSFSYNLGTGATEEIIDSINAGASADALESEWKSYNHAAGITNADLTARRAAEWSLWTS